MQFSPCCTEITTALISTTWEILLFIVHFTNPGRVGLFRIDADVVGLRKGCELVNDMIWKKKNRGEKLWEGTLS